MKKSLLLCFLTLVVSVALISAFQSYVLKVKVQAANVRSEPDRNAAVVKTLQLGAILESNNKIGEWFEIIVDDGKGNKISAYINTSVVDIVSTGAAPAVQPPVQQPVQPPVQAPVQAPAQVPAYQPPTAYAAPKMYSKGGIRLLGGLTSSNITYDKARLQAAGGGTDFSQYIVSRSGFMGGIGFEIGSQFSFEFDVMYMPKGVKFQGQYDATAQGGSKTDFNIDMVMNQVSVPVFIKVKILPGTTPFLIGGGEVGYILSSKAVSVTTSNGQTQNSEQDLLKNDQGESTLNRLDYGLVFGGGIELNLEGLTFTLEGRYYMGLANLFKQTQVSTSEGSTSSDYFRSKALVVLGGIKF